MFQTVTILIMRTETFTGPLLDSVGVNRLPRLRRWIMMMMMGSFEGGRLDSGKVLLEEVDESVGGGVVGVNLCGIFEL